MEFVEFNKIEGVVIWPKCLLAQIWTGVYFFAVGFGTLSV